MPLAEQRGGGEMMLRHLMKHGRSSDIDWMVIFFEQGPLASEFRDLGIDVRVVPAGRLRHLHRFVGTVSKIASIARTYNVDLIFSWGSKAHLYGSLAALLAGTAAAWYQLGYPTGRHLSAVDRIATLMPACGIFTLSKAGSAGQANLWPKRPMHLVYPGVKLDDFNPDQLPDPPEARRRLGLPEDRPIIGIVGRLQRWKGIHTLIQAMPKILESRPRAHCVIVGGEHDLEPEYASYIEDLINELDLKDDVTLAGFHQNVPVWMQAMDIIVHASDNEPFGIVVIEAMALGKPVVAGGEGGPREVITEDSNGLLAPFENPDVLAQKILKYLNRPDFAARLGRNARKRAQEFEAEHFADRFTEALRKLEVES